MDPILNSSERPARDYLDVAGVHWRHEKPNYDKVDLKYLKAKMILSVNFLAVWNRLWHQNINIGRTRTPCKLQEKTTNWRAGSLEKIVENLVKTWEMESSHKIRAEDWGTIDQKNFKIVVNGRRTFDINDNIQLGNYNLLMMDSVFHDPKTTNEESHKMFKAAFPNGFAWELTELFSGPPTAMFSWRHWATFDGPYGKHQPTGEEVVLHGVAIVQVNSDLKVQKLEVYFDVHPMMAALLGAKGPCSSGCPLINGKARL